MKRAVALGAASRSDCFKAAGIVGAWSHDTASDRVVADFGVARLFGIAEPDPANGDPMERYVQAVHPADRAGFFHQVKIASETGSPFAAQYRIMTQNRVSWVHDYGSFCVDSTGKPLRGKGIVIDVTQTRRNCDAVDELARQPSLSATIEDDLTLLATHVIAASEIARTLPSGRLRGLTDPLLWEVGRLLGWASTKFK